MIEQPKFYVNDSGDQIWYLPSQGKLCFHRLEGPAVLASNGNRAWWVEGKLHRTNGPALEYNNDGKDYRAWFINGKEISEEVETWIEEFNIDINSDAGKMRFKLRWV